MLKIENMLFVCLLSVLKSIPLLLINLAETNLIKRIKFDSNGNTNNDLYFKYNIHSIVLQNQCLKGEEFLFNAL